MQKINFGMQEKEGVRRQKSGVSKNIGRFS